LKVLLDNITKIFGRIIAVNNLNLEIDDGKLVVLLGPSGCGKSTTLLMIAGIYRPTEGEIWFGDKVVNDLPPRDRKIGLVFQSYALYPHMTVFENIAFPLRLKKENKEEINRKVREISEFLEINELLERKPIQLSGGQQQRVAVARALVKSPDILLLDEPLSNLDAKLRVMMRSELKKMQMRLGITTIFVTHDQSEAMTVADKIAVIKNGVLQQYSSSDELYDLPRNIFVATFIGSPPMNIIEGSIQYEGGNLFFLNPDVRFSLPKDLEFVLKQKRNTKDVLFGVRPEDVNISMKETTQDSISWIIDMVEMMGRELLVTLSRGKTILKTLIDREHSPSIGDRVNIEFSGRVFLFDKESGKNLLCEE